MSRRGFSNYYDASSRPTRQPELTEAQRAQQGWDAWCDKRIEALLLVASEELADILGSEVGKAEREFRAEVQTLFDEIAKKRADLQAATDAEIKKHAELQAEFGGDLALLRSEIETLRGEISSLRAALGSDCAIVPLD